MPLCIPMSSFVSSSDIDAGKRLKKEKRHEMRERILKDAKEDYERKKKQEERRLATGEDKWIAPGVSERLGLGSERKRKKKSKKEHKKSKSKRSKHSRENVSSEGSDSTEDMWVEKSTAGSVGVAVDQSAETGNEDQSPTQRDEWMTTPLMSSMLSMCSDTVTEKRKKDDTEESKETMLSSFDTPGQHPLELNPFWKEGGSGLPLEQQQSKETKSSSSRVNDAGRSWILRSYKRALEQAESEGKSLEEIATTRWGSLEKLHSLLRTAGIDPDDPDRKPRKERREYLHSSGPHCPSNRRDIYEFDRTTKQVTLPKISENQLTRKSGHYLKPGEATEAVQSVSGTAHPRHTSSRNWLMKKPKEEMSVHSSRTREDIEMEQPVPTDTHCPADETSSETHTQAESTAPVTDSKLNSIAAKLMKAELLGDEDRVKRLTVELETLRKLKEMQAQSCTKDNRDSQKKTVVLVTTDRFGRVQPLESHKGYSQRSFPKASSGRSKKGKQKRIYDDEDGISLKSIMEEERRMTAEDTHAAIARMASKFVPAANSEETVDDALDSNKATRYDPAKQEKARRDRAIFESRKMTEILENCQFCFGNHNFDKHLLVAVGIGVYLAVPSHQSLTEGHCLLVPMEHTTCSLQLDENIWSEVQIFQKGLTRMFSDHDMDVIFTESYMSATKKSHMYIECIPMPKEEGSLAPMYFKKAIQESDTEWSDNKKLVDTRKKGVRNSLPCGLPYFYVDFGLDGGYAHIIEDQSKFPNYFAKEIVGGMLDVEPRLWLKPPRENFENQKQKVNKLSEWWQPYDWTQKLKNN